MKSIILICMVCLMSCKPSGTLYFTVKAYSPSQNLSTYYLRSGTQRIMLIDSNEKYQLGDTFKLVKLKRIVYE